MVPKRLTLWKLSKNTLEFDAIILYLVTPLYTVQINAFHYTGVIYCTYFHLVIIEF